MTTNPQPTESEAPAFHDVVLDDLPIEQVPYSILMLRAADGHQDAEDELNRRARVQVEEQTAKAIAE